VKRIPKKKKKVKSAGQWSFLASKKRAQKVGDGRKRREEVILSRLSGMGRTRAGNVEETWAGLFRREDYFWRAAKNILRLFLRAR